MNWNDEEIDGIFKEAAQNVVIPPYEDAFFAEFEKMLPQKKKRIFGLWFFASTGLASLLLASYFITSHNEPKNKALLSLKDSNQQLKELKITKEPINENLSIIGALEKSKNLKQEVQKPDSRRQVFRPNLKLNVEDNLDAEIAYINTRLELNENVPVVSSTNTLISTKNENEFLENITTAKLATLALTKPVFLTSETNLLVAPLWNKKVKTHAIYIELGIGATQSYLNTPEKSTKPMPTISLETGYQFLNKNWAIAAGLRYQLMKPDNLQLTRASKVYGFDVSTFGQTMQYTSISSVELPIQFSLIHNKHRLGFALATTYNLGSSIHFVKTKNGLEIGNTNLYFNKNAMKTWGIKPEISYQLMCKRGIEFGVTLSMQSINPLEKNKFAGVINKTPFAGQIHLRKSINFK